MPCRALGDVALGQAEFMGSSGGGQPMGTPSCCIPSRAAEALGVIPAAGLAPSALCGAAGWGITPTVTPRSHTMHEPEQFMFFQAVSHFSSTLSTYSWDCTKACSTRCAGQSSQNGAGGSPWLRQGYPVPRWVPAPRTQHRAFPCLYLFASPVPVLCCP